MFAVLLVNGIVPLINRWPRCPSPWAGAAGAGEEVAMSRPWSRAPAAGASPGWSCCCSPPFRRRAGGGADSASGRASRQQARNAAQRRHGAADPPSCRRREWPATARNPLGGAGAARLAWRARGRGIRTPRAPTTASGLGRGARQGQGFADRIELLHRARPGDRRAHRDLRPGPEGDPGARRLHHRARTLPRLVRRPAPADAPLKVVKREVDAESVRARSRRSPARRSRPSRSAAIVNTTVALSAAGARRRRPRGADHAPATNRPPSSASSTASCRRTRPSASCSACARRWR